MAVEEPRVIAAASNAARLVRAGGGFTADADDPIMTAQIEVHGRERQRGGEGASGSGHGRAPGEGGGRATPPRRARRRAARAGGARRFRDGAVIACTCTSIARDAMGANMVNTVAEALADRVAALAGGRRGLRILTNLCDRRCVRVQRARAGRRARDRATWRAAVRDGIVAASRFAEDDPYRAATHNKGIMNGVDAVAIATGNDWRGDRGRRARLRRRWKGATGRSRSGGPCRRVRRMPTSCGQLEMPLAIGIVGGTLHAHAGARLAQRLIGASDARTLAMVVASAGLATNLAALRALATDGIQRGHMSASPPHRAERATPPRDRPTASLTEPGSAPAGRFDGDLPGQLALRVRARWKKLAGQLEDEAVGLDDERDRAAVGGERGREAAAVGQRLDGRLIEPVAEAAKDARRRDPPAGIERDAQADLAFDAGALGFRRVRDRAAAGVGVDLRHRA